MERHTWMVIVLLGAGLAMPGSATAGHHKKKADCCDGVMACYAWQLQEIQEVVYTVEYKEVKKTIKRPVIKEIKRPVSCRVCVPFSRTVLRERLVPDYCRKIDSDEQVVRHKYVDECGVCHESCEVVPQIVTCLVKAIVPQLIPVLEWELIPVEHKYDKKYLVREWVDEEVTVRVPCKTPKTITRKVWVKVPYCPPACEPCETCEPCEPCETCEPCQTCDPCRSCIEGCDKAHCHCNG